jgi:drug/metabolite transporter (DMT)-like permease
VHGRTVILTALSLVAFTSNSLLCREALGAGTLDAATFTAVRLLSGAIVLSALSLAAAVREPSSSRADWRSGFFLFAYAVAFSFAYLDLSVGTGALILFAAVQATIIAGAMRSGQRLHAREWSGIALALAGLAYLTTPGLSAPSLQGSILMAGAGVAWGLYTLRGRRCASPLSDTTRNFVRATPMAIVVLVPALSGIHVSPRGVMLAAASGALASGVGYVLWYAALRRLSAARAAVVQLAVPVVAALGGVVFLSERITPRLVLAGAMILGGIACAVLSRAEATVAPRGKPRGA